MHKVFRVVAAAMALLVTLSATGCADTTWAVKVNGKSVSSGVYVAYLLSYRSDVLSSSGSGSSATDSGSSGNNPLSVTSSDASSAKSASSNPWDRKIDGDSASAWAVNSALKDCERLAVTEALASSRKLSLTSSETSTAKQYAQTYYTYYTAYKSNGISQTSMQRLLSYQYLLKKVFDSYYGKGGEKAVADADLKNYYTANFVHIKQIFFNKYDDSGNLLAADKLAQVKANAQKVFALAQAGKGSFDSLVTQYNEDSGMKSNPDGYIFDKSSSYLQVFKDTAFAMNVGDVKLIESDEGYHIMYKVAVDPSASTYNDDMKETVLESMKWSDFQSLIDQKVKQAKIVKNAHTLNKYNPETLKDK